MSTHTAVTAPIRNDSGRLILKAAVVSKRIVSGNEVLAIGKTFVIFEEDETEATYPLVNLIQSPSDLFY